MRAGLADVSAQQWASRTKGISVLAEGNLMQSVNNRWGMPDEVKDHVHWLGKDNSYAGLWKGPDGKTPGLRSRNWQLGQAESGSREVAEVPLAWRTDLPGDAAGAISWWQSRLTRARAESGIENLGPDLSLIGSGDAYVRALAADGHPVAKEQLRPEPHPAARSCWSATARNVRGFLSLPAAMAAAADGDILRIRSDRPQDEAEVPQNRGSITLRAGPGYRPTIAKPLAVDCGTALAVEGLTFSDGSFLGTKWREGVPLESEGRISRLASCTFDGARIYAVVASGETGAGGEETAGPDASTGKPVPSIAGVETRVTRHASRATPLPPAKSFAAWFVGRSSCSLATPRAFPPGSASARSTAGSVSRAATARRSIWTAARSPAPRSAGT